MCDSSGQQDEWMALEAAIARLRARTRGGRTSREIGPELIRLRRAIDQCELEFAMLSGELDATGEFDPEHGESAYQWIRDECNVSGRIASDALAVAEQREVLPGSLAAMEDGRIGFGHVARMAHTAAALTQSPTAAPFVERELLRQAERHSVSRFGRDCTHARHAADAAAFVAEHVNAVEARFLQVSARDDGCVWLRGFIDSVGAASVRTVLESLGRRDGADDIRRRDRRMADALVELAEHALHNNEIAGGGARAPQLMVTVSLETLRNTPGAAAADLEFAGPVPAETARRLACSGTVIPVWTDKDSRVVDVGRARRMPGITTRRKLVMRDGGCVWPGCDRPASWTVPHHVVHHANGGGHQIENLVLLCGRHHWKVHEGGWELIVTEDGRILTLAPRSDVPRARPPTTTAA